MTRIDRYIIRQMGLPFLLATLVTVFVTVAIGVEEQLSNLLARVPIVQITLGDIAAISALLTPALAGYIFPISLLLGIMLAFSGMAVRNELTALKASGVSMKRAIVPAVVMGGALSLLTFAVHDYLQPMAHKNLSRLVTSDLPLRVSIDMLPPGAMHAYGDWRVYIGQRDDAGVMHDITVLQERGPGEADAFYADQARVVREGDASYLVLEEGNYVPADMSQKYAFESMRHKIPSLDPRNPLTSRYGMPLTELWEAEQAQAKLVDRMPTSENVRELRKQRIELAERLSFPLMCLAVSVASAPLAARARGRAGSFASSILVICAYYTIRKVAEPSSLPSLGEAFALAQAPNLILLAVGAGLLWRVDRV